MKRNVFVSFTSLQELQTESSTPRLPSAQALPPPLPIPAPFPLSVASSPFPFSSQSESMEVGGRDAINRDARVPSRRHTHSRPELPPLRWPSMVPPPLPGAAPPISTRPRAGLGPPNSPSTPAVRSCAAQHSKMRSLLLHAVL